MTMNSTYTGLEIAIIGLSGRFPGGHSLADFWENLAAGQELISVFPTDPQGGADATAPHPPPIRAGSILADVDQFDAAFFGFNPREAEAMDPQHRLFLECAWEALEHAGYRTDLEERPIGVFAGVGMGTYLLYNLSPNPGVIESRGLLQTLVGVDKDYLATRVSYKLNLTGPSLSLGTACSSSLVAVHVACQSLLSGDCDMALAAGVAVKVPQTDQTLSPDEIISPDGHCRAFDAQANGTVGGNGIGVVLLKRLADAIADRDSIYAVIKGSAINNDGSTKVGYTAPSQAGQARVIRAAQIMAEVDPDTITYLETHGTGTALGDPIEIAAMTQAFRACTHRTGFCAIGSVKTNVGHLDAAAGMAGLIKTVLALHHGKIPPSLNFEVPNPQIDFASSPFYVNTQLRDWPLLDIAAAGEPDQGTGNREPRETDLGSNPNGASSNAGVRRAGVSSFGFGGTNAHVVLESAPALPVLADARAPRTYQLLSLSAKTASALEHMTTHLADHLRRHPNLALADVAYILHQGRWEFPHRRMVVAQTQVEALQALESGDPQRVHTQVAGDAAPGVVFMFPGQGSQAIHMARELYEGEPVFQAICDRCFTTLQTQHGLDLQSVIYPTAAQIAFAQQRLTQTEIAQPALFVVEYALAHLWMAWGVQPQALIGHSIGEYVAACLAGVLTLEDALAVVVARGRLMQQQPPGAMLAVHLSETDLQPWLADRLVDNPSTTLALAASNAPELTVVAGDGTAISALQAQFDAAGIHTTRLLTSHAFHSPMMEAVMDPLIAVLQRVTLHPPQIPLISNRTGTELTAAQATSPQYWADHLRHPVQFAQGIQTLLTQPNRVFLEVGPGRTLTTLVQQQDRNRLILSSLPHPKDPTADEAWLLQTLGQLWLAGVPIRWSPVYADQARQRVPLPTYPFERQRYWIDPPTVDSVPSGSEAAGSTLAPLTKNPDLADWFYVPSWQRSSLPVLPRPQPDSRPWIVFADQRGLAAALIQRLLNEGQRVIRVEAGSDFQCLGGSEYRMNACDRTHYDRLFQALLTGDDAPILVHLWTVDDRDAADDQNATSSQTLGFYSLISLAQALGQLSSSQTIHLGVVSSGIHNITGMEAIHPAQATLIGPCRVIPQEFSSITCGLIDVAWPAASSRSADPFQGHATQDSIEPATGKPATIPAQMVDQVLGEIRLQAAAPHLPIPQAPPPIVAYRGPYRWLPTYEPMRLEATDPVLGQPLDQPLRQRGIYLITGGLGGLGWTIAEHLGQTVQAKLVLISRSPFPNRADWANWLATRGESEITTLRIQQIQALEAMGAEVLVLSADVADVTQMQAAVDCARQTFGDIHGIFHAAGIAGGGIIPLKTADQAAEVMRAKVRGTQVLQQIFRDQPLDFWVLFSSLSALLGGAGQVDYCAANAYLDACAQAQIHPAIRVINWDTWQSVGMGANITHLPDALKQQRLAALADGLTPTEGWESLRRILRSGLTHVVVSTKAWDQVLAQPHDLTAMTPEFSPGDASPHLGHARPATTTPYVAPSTEIEQRIAALWQEQLGIEPIGIHDNFFELGGHSLLAVRVVARLREMYPVELSLRLLLSDAPTVAGMALAITHQLNPPPDDDTLQQLLAEIEQLSEAEVRSQLAEESRL